MRLIIENLGKSFAGRRVFSNISAQVNQGEILAIVGPNGAGKTTLLRLLASMLQPTCGRVTLEIDQRKLTGSQIMPFVGMVSPDLQLYEELTGHENIRFFATVGGVPTNDLAHRFAAFGLAGRESDLVAQYSAGMKQRLKYILALLRNPILLLLDEPTANLDDQGKKLVRDLLAARQQIIVVASNEMSDYDQADRVIELGR